MGRRNRQPEREGFQCEDCHVRFAKAGSLSCHIQNYCIKRLEVPPSSTVTSQMLMNNSPHIAGMADPRTQSCMRALESEMVNKRSALIASVKTALGAQIVISHHEKTQEQKEKAFKKLYDIFSIDEALTADTLPEERHFVERAKTAAISTVRRVNVEEMYAAEAVARVLHKQKVAIEAAVVATTREQTALVVVMQTLKELEIESGSASRILTQHAGFSNVEIAFTGVGTAPGRKAAQQKTAAGVATEASSVGEPASSINGSSKNFGKQRKGKSFSSSTSDMPKTKISRKSPHPKKIMNLNAVTSGESQAVSTGEVLPKPIVMHGSMCKDFPQPKAMVGSNAVTPTEETSLVKQTSINESSVEQRKGKGFSSSTSDTPREKIGRKWRRPKTIMNSNAVTSDKYQTVSTGEVLPKPVAMHGSQCKDFPQHEVMDLSVATSHKKIAVRKNWNKRKRQPQQAMDLKVVASDDNSSALTSGIQQRRLPHDIPQSEGRVDLKASHDNGSALTSGIQQRRLPHSIPQFEELVHLNVATAGLGNMHI